MDILREFLESSTIHGLSYISTSKVTYYLMPQLERIVITIYIDIKPAIFRSLVQLHLFAWCVTHYVMLLWMYHWLLREGIKKIDFFLGKSPKLWVGGGQES